MLYLASKSPRRRELLEQVGVAFTSIDLDLPEVRAAGESAHDYVRRVACEKALAGMQSIRLVDGAVVLGADTEVVLDDDVFGKPADAAHARTMLRRLSGRTHHAISAVCCVDATRSEHTLSVTAVTFAALDDAMIDAYIATGEASGRAGGYAIQGRAAAFVSTITGSYSGVMGLPLFETLQLLRKFEAFAGAQLLVCSQEGAFFGR